MSANEVTDVVPGALRKVERFGDAEGRRLFFLHGWAFSKESEIADFEPALRGRPGWRRIYTDLPGMGARNDEGAGITNLNELLDWVISFINVEAPDQPFAIAGMSVGGQLARGVVERMPERVLGLFLRVPRLIANRSERSVYDPAKPVPEGRNERDAFLDLDDLGAPMPPRFYAENDERHARWVTARASANLDALETIEATYELDPLPVSVFDGPTLIVVGRQDSRVGFLEALESGQEVRPGVGIALHEQYPRATIAALDRAGHALPVGSPALFHALVREWLDRVEEVS
ncbi:MAG: alpha/beta fold hydrolase [Acetobacteraceae bacterium]